MAYIIALVALFGVLALLQVCPNRTRTIFSNVPNGAYYGFTDLKDYIVHKGKNLYKKVGIIYAYCGAFGKGKTLSAVHDARMIYRKYDGKLVWFKGEWRTQVVKVYSNVVIKDVPYVKLDTLMQIVDVAQNQPDYDDLHGLHTINVFLIDELSSLLNSRNFATNLNFDVVASLLQCRKANTRLLYTAQNFSEVDALIRRNTHYVVQCNKLWRLMFGLEYDAKDLENAVNPLLVKPLTDYGWFVTNKDYNCYDTYSQALKVDKNASVEDFISTDEAYLRLTPNCGGLENVSHLNRRGKKRL